MSVVLLERLEKEGAVPLERYGHQVGGHFLFFKFEDTICKPLIAREHFFYQTVPPLLKRYLPAYHGVVNVRYVSQPTGEIQVVASPIKVQPLPVPPRQGVATTEKATPHRTHQRAAAGNSSGEAGGGGGEVGVCNGNGDAANGDGEPVSSVWEQGKFPKCTTGNTIHSDMAPLITAPKGNGESYNNPWAIMCGHNMDERLKELDNLENFVKDYMILENLTSKYQRPCVLDLKVGTRQHGDDAPPYKVQKHMYTCSITTSSSLGVRMAGMQKYDASKGKYIFYDKYFGKQLTIEEFRQVILSFFSNNVCFRSDVIPVLLRMLSDQRARIKATPTYRYFSSSLLVLYDGAVCPEGLAKLDRASGADRTFSDIVQRARSTDQEGGAKDSSPSSSSSSDASRCVESLAKKQSQQLQQNGSPLPLSSSSSSETGHVHSTPTPSKEQDQAHPTPTPSKEQDCTTPTPSKEQDHTPTTITPANEPSLSPSPAVSAREGFMGDEELAEARQVVDLRMIDFAHATHAGYVGDRIAYDDFDEGYLQGLDYLIAMFSEIQHKYCRSSLENGCGPKR